MTSSVIGTSHGALAAVLAEHPGDPTAPVLHTMSRSVELRQLRTATATLAAQLTAAGVRPGESVACIIDEGIEAVAAAFATWQVGAVLVPLNHRLTDTELGAALVATAPAAVVTAEPGRVPIPVPILARGEPLTWVASGARPTTVMMTYDRDAALVMRTSGTTGASKAVVLRHEGVLRGIDNMANQLRSTTRASGREPMPNLIPASLALWAGLWNTLFGLRVGAPVVLLDGFRTVDYAGLVKRFAIRSTILAPAMMSMLTNDDRVTDLSPLRSVRSVTAPLTPAQARAFQTKFGVSVLNCYGQTELGSEVVGWTASDVREFGDAKLGAVGRPHPGVELKILDADHNEVPVGGLGEIWIASPFASQEDASLLARLRDGFLQTGDLGRLDPDGFLWLDGRVADLVNRGGLKVVPQEVEDVLREQHGVADACVCAVPDERLGEVPVAWVVPKTGARLDEAALLAAVRTVLAPYKVPVAIRLVGDFPRNEIGKVLRRELAATYDTTTSDTTTSDTTTSAITTSEGGRA